MLTEFARRSIDENRDEMLDIGLIFARANARGFAGSTRGGVDEPGARLFALRVVIVLVAGRLLRLFVLGPFRSLTLHLLRVFVFGLLRMFALLGRLFILRALFVFVFVLLLLVMVVRLTQGGFLDVSVGRDPRKRARPNATTLDASENRGLRPRESVEIQSVRVAEVGARAVILAADDVHGPIHEESVVEATLTRWFSLCLHAMPHDRFRIADVGIVRRGGRVRRATTRVIPDGAAPNPHALLVVQNRRVLVTTHGKTTADHGVAELHRIQVERQNLTDVETQTSLHDEAAVDDHSVILGHDRRRTRAPERKRLAVLVRVFNYHRHLKRPLRDHVVAFIREFEFNFAPLLVVETERVERIQALVILVSAAEDDQGVLFGAFTEIGVLTILGRFVRSRRRDAVVAFVVFVVDVKRRQFSPLQMFSQHRHVGRVRQMNRFRRDDGDFFIPLARAIALQSRTVAVRLTERGFPIF